MKTRESILAGFLFVLLFAIASCADVYGPTGPQGPQGPAGPSANSPTLTMVQQMVVNENVYRNSVGQESLIPGLNCSLSTVPTTTAQIVGATLTGIGNFEYLGVFNQSNTDVTVGFNVLPVSIQPIYQTWFVMKCTGSLVIGDDNWHGFDLTSDDGANLYVDGLLINNDDLHSVGTKSAVKYLKYGFHSFELDYFQATGQQALILNEDGKVMSDSGFYH